MSPETIAELTNSKSSESAAFIKDGKVLLLPKHKRRNYKGVADKENTVQKKKRISLLGEYNTRINSQVPSQ